MRRRRQLGFSPVVSPSIDPVSIAIDAIAGVGFLISLFGGQKAQRQRQENEVVQVQNKLAAAADPISQAAQNPDVTADELSQLYDELQTQARDFYDFTFNYPIAGPGARETIFGDEVAPGQFETTAAHPGWITKLLDYIKRKIEEVTGVQQQLGFDWERLIGIGAGVANSIFNPGGTTTITTTPAPPPATVNLNQQLPSWFWPALIVGGAILVLKK